MLEKEPKQGKKFQYLRIYNLEKIWSRIHLVPKIFGPEFTWSRKYLVPNSPLGPEFTWSRIHLILGLCNIIGLPIYCNILVSNTYCNTFFRIAIYCVLSLISFDFEPVQVQWFFFRN